MRYVLNLISFVILVMIVGLGSLALGTGRAVAQDCKVSITKSASPANNFTFVFVATGESGEFTSELKDPDSPETSFGMNVGETETVTEEDANGWALESIVCTEGVTNCGGPGEFVPCLTATVDGNSVTFECLDSDTASCVFTNVVAPSNIPTLSEWGLIAMAGILGIAGFMVVMRRRKAAA